MVDDYLKGTRNRSLEDDSNISEAELRTSHESIRDSWIELQRIKTVIAEAKRKAIDLVEKQYADELKSAMDDYAMQITLSR